MSSKPRVVLSNGVEITGSRRYIFDAQAVDPDAVHCISHVHSDHIPRRASKGEAVCSDVTLRCINACTKHSFTQISDENITLFNAGHTAGSSMFRLEDEISVLYTGDFSTRSRFGMEGAKPQKTDVLITESTFGRPEYVFPDQNEMGAIIRDWAEDSLSQGYTTVIQAYPFGKSQDLLRILDGLEVYTDEDIGRATAAAAPELICRPYSASIKEPFILICKPYSRKKASEMPWSTLKLKTAAVSGWSMKPSYKYAAGVDEAFPLSDHAGFDELLSFAEKCSPSLVLTHHGYAGELSEEIRNRLGIDARPLIRGQSSIFDY